MRRKASRAHHDIATVVASRVWGRANKSCLAVLHEYRMLWGVILQAIPRMNAKHLREYVRPVAAWFSACKGPGAHWGSCNVESNTTR